MRKLVEPPEWFDISEYAAAKRLDATGWYIQLSIRRVLLDMFPADYHQSSVAPAKMGTGDSGQGAPLPDRAMHHDLFLLEEVRSCPVGPVLHSAAAFLLLFQRHP